ncbi:unnamed protein product, partial [Medioppia subpectinata]
MYAKCKSEKGFSVATVWTQHIPDLLSRAKCDDRSQCVIRVEAPNFNASSFLLLTEPKNAKLVKPNLRLVSVLRDDKHLFSIKLYTEAVAPFVALDLKPGSGISGHFVDNGFFMFDETKTVQFVYTGNEAVDEQDIADNLIIKTVTDVI